MAPALSGCLDTTPEYTVPDPVPPVIDVGGVVPPTNKVYGTKDASVKFTVPFRADDLGEAPIAYFFHDTVLGKPAFPVDKSVSVSADPRPFAEQTNRSVSFKWDWAQKNIPVGCHTLTVILSHPSNIDTTAGLVDVRDSLAAAQVTWFLALSDPVDPTKTAECGEWPNVAIEGAP